MRRCDWSAQVSASYAYASYAPCDGTLSGRVKLNVYLVREAQKMLARRAEASQDSRYLKDRVTYLEDEMGRVTRENSALRKEVRRLKEELRDKRANSPAVRSTEEKRSPETQRNGDSERQGLGPLRDPEGPVAEEAKIYRPGKGNRPLNASEYKTILASLGCWEQVIVKISERLKKLEEGPSLQTPALPPTVTPMVATVATAEGAKKRRRKKKEVKKAETVTTVPPPPPSPTSVGENATTEGTWSEVVKRKKGGRGKNSKLPPPVRSMGDSKKVAQPGDGATPAPKKKRTALAAIKRRIPRTAAVLVTCPEGQAAA